MARSRRAPVSRKPALRTLSSDGDAEDDEDDSSGGYLPFAATAKAGKDDPSATLRDPTKRHSSGQQPNTAPARRPKEPPPPAPESSTSSASSAQPVPSSSSERASSEHVSSNQRPLGPISPKHRAQLANANISPRYRRDGSEGSPSMGSSFSDLDDASVTQSALEDALLSNLQHGQNMSIASRLGGLRDVIRRQQ